MKKLILKCGLIACMLLSVQAQAQVKVNVNINLQPDWGPSGYDYVEYYYIPDIDMYYSVPHRKYVYRSGGNWIWVTTLPSYCRNYNIRTGYKVVVNEKNPFAHHEMHKKNYGKYKNHHGKQKNIKGNHHNYKSPGKYHNPGKGNNKHQSPGKGHGGGGKGHGNGGKGHGNGKGHK